jgi:hypothetical protein
MTGGAYGSGAKWKRLRMVIDIPYRTEYVTEQVLMRQMKLMMNKLRSVHGKNVGHPDAKNIKYVMPHVEKIELEDGTVIDSSY